MVSAFFFQFDSVEAKEAEEDDGSQDSFETFEDVTHEAIRKRLRKKGEDLNDDNILKERKKIIVKELKYKFEWSRLIGLAGKQVSISKRNFSS